MPAEAAVTFTVMVQMLFADNVPFAKEMDVSLPVNAGENAPAPQPLYVTPGVPDTTKPLGKESAKLTPVKL